MRHNGRAPVYASALPAQHLALYPDERPQAACPDCGAWRLIRRGMLMPHRASDGVRRCRGSGQRIRLDETPAQWLLRLADGARDANQRHPSGGRLRKAPPPPVAPAVHQLAVR